MVLFLIFLAALIAVSEPALFLLILLALYLISNS